MSVDDNIGVGSIPEQFLNVNLIDVGKYLHISLGIKDISVTINNIYLYFNDLWNKPYPGI